MGNIAIQVESLYKQYQVGKSRTRYNTIRETIVNALDVTLPRRLKKNKSETIWALQDISFEVDHGEALGIIGRNGSGKTTLLKILSRITEPTKGRAKVYGRIGALLEVGIGFHQELTGRENIYLYGAILGMKRTEIKQKFDEIVEFAEIEKFLETPVKHYSSGMYVRLAFAVAAHLEPDILFVDEVLAVGDIAFQRKCLGKMGDISRGGRTVLFVSHNLGIISQLCERTLWLKEGHFAKIGSTSEVIHDYLNYSSASTIGTWTNPLVYKKESGIRLLSACIVTQEGVSASVVRYDEKFYLEVHYEVVTLIESWALIFRLKDTSGTVVFTSWDTDSIGYSKSTPIGIYSACCFIPANLLRPGIYFVTLGAHVPRGGEFEIQEDIFQFEVSSVGYAMNWGRLGVITPVLEWSIRKCN
jgi:lipopolysaccharide transport system ATP-binding protein